MHLEEFNIIDFCNKFDKIIGLKRNNIHECAISAQSFISKNEYLQYNIIDENWLNLNQGEIYLRENELTNVKNDVLNVSR